MTDKQTSAERLREIAASIDELDVGIGNDLRRIAGEHEKNARALLAVMERATREAATNPVRHALYEVATKDTCLLILNDIRVAMAKE